MEKAKERGEDDDRQEKEVDDEPIQGVRTGTSCSAGWRNPTEHGATARATWRGSAPTTIQDAEGELEDGTRTETKAPSTTYKRTTSYSSLRTEHTPSHYVTNTHPKTRTSS